MYADGLVGWEEKIKLGSPMLEQELCSQMGTQTRAVRSKCKIILHKTANGFDIQAGFATS